jgi:hypothetical protein
VNADGAIARECTVFTRHLLGMDPDAYVVSRYGMAVSTVPALTPDSAWDRALLAVARWHVVSARCADAHAGLFDRSATLRKRLVMLLAILESRPPFSRRIDAAPAGGPAVALAAVVLRGLSSLLALAIGTIFLLPLRLFFLGRGARRSLPFRR